MLKLIEIKFNKYSMMICCPKILNFLSSGPKDEKDEINFYEHIHSRQCAVAWALTIGQRTLISKPEPLNTGMKILPHFTAHERK